MIVSKNNEKIKEIKKLATSGEYFVLATEKLIQEGVDAKLDFLCVICSDLKKFSGLLSKISGEVIEADTRVIESVSSVKTSSGILAIAKNTQNTEIDIASNLLVLDGLQDPGNVGTLVRSALGANFKTIIAVESVKKTNEKLLRSAMGALFKVNYFSMSRSDFVDFAKTNSLYLICADMHGENVFSQKIPPPFSVVVGNEGNGLSREIKNICKKTLSIPMQNGLESLNAGVSGSIIMYQLTKGEIK